MKEAEQKAKESKTRGPEENFMGKFFIKLEKLSHDNKISSRIRFAIMVSFTAFASQKEFLCCKWGVF